MIWIPDSNTGNTTVIPSLWHGATQGWLLLPVLGGDDISARMVFARVEAHTVNRISSLRPGEVVKYSTSRCACQMLLTTWPYSK